MSIGSMRRGFVRAAATLWLCLPTVACSGDAPTGAAAVDPQLEGHERSRVTIETTAGDAHAFDVFLATSPEQRARGLMHVEHLAPDAGMLFFFEVSRRLSFYMKNTLLSLDILFIDSDGRVINIAEHTTPGSLASIPSNGRARAVLELNAGTSDRLSITPGARVRHPFFD